jgi:hypothetical protein
MHICEIRLHKDKRDVDLLSDAVIRVYDEAGSVIETHEHTGRAQRMVNQCAL